MGVLSIKFSVRNLAGLQNDSFKGHYSEAEELVGLCVSQFGRDEGTTASRYFASNILERMAHNEPEIDYIAAQNLENVVQTLFLYCPQNQGDKRPETRVAILLASVLLNVWRRLAEKKVTDHGVLFSQVLMPLFDVMGVKSDGKAQTHLLIIQSMFIEMLRHIGSFDDLRPSIKSGQMHSILDEFANNPNPEIAKEATLTLQQLEF
jgi:hypothetical protein